MRNQRQKENKRVLEGKGLGQGLGHVIIHDAKND